MKLEIKGTAIDYARSATITELKKKVKAIKAGEYDEYSDRCRVCFEKFIAGDLEQAQWWSNHAETVK